MENILSGAWPVGHMLPTELSLCEQFGVSRPSVRTALLSLVNEGYLIRVKGKGTFVTTPKRVEESTIFIESFAEEMLRRGKEIETEVLEFRMMQPDEYIRSQLQIPDDSGVLKLSRLRYCKDHIEDGPIVLSTSYYTRKLDFLQNYDFSTISVHRAMAEHGMEKKYTEKHIRVTFLDARSSRLMCVSAGSPALSVISYTRDAGNELIEYCESFYPANRNEFILKIRL